MQRCLPPKQGNTTYFIHPRTSAIVGSLSNHNTLFTIVLFIQPDTKDFSCDYWCLSFIIAIPSIYLLKKPLILSCLHIARRAHTRQADTVSILYNKSCFLAPLGLNSFQNNELSAVNVLYTIYASLAFVFC